MSGGGPGRAQRSLVVRLLSAHGVTGFGDGLWYTLWAIYLISVRGIPPTTMGLAMGVGSGIGLLIAVPIGTMADRRGPRDILALLSLLRAMAMVGFFWVSDFWTLLPAAGVLVACQSVGAGVRVTLISKLVEDGQRLRVLAMSRVTQHIAYAGGAGLGAVVLGVNSAAGFRWAIGVTVACLLVAAALTMAVQRVAPVPAQGRGVSTMALRDRPFLLIMMVTAPLALCWSILSTGLPLWTQQHTTAPTWVSGAAVALSSIAIALFQVRVSNRAVSAAWAVRASLAAGFALATACLFFFAAGQVSSPSIAVGVIMIGVGAHAFSELHYVAARWGLSLRLMVPGAEGQYQAVVATTEAAVMAVGPAVVALALALDGGLGWVALGLVVLVPLTPLKGLVRSGVAAADRHDHLPGRNSLISRTNRAAADSIR